MKPTLQELLEQLPEQVVNHIQNLERMRQDFVANVSHELRTPLTVIHGYLELLIEQDIDENKPWKKIFLQMQQQTLRMENLIENLLLLSRLESQDEERPQSGKTINVPHLLTIIVDEAIELSGDSSHQFKLKTDNHLYIQGHEEELRSLFSNIIFNAVKYTPAHGTININWQEKNQKAYFSVQDSGIGIATEHIPKLTERFYRVDPARSRTSGGTGLGLAIAKHVLIRHQAILDIHSDLGKGSLFTCIFPLERTRYHSL
jgi:two-component system phosphate regulon sensor histidine kinase PhoR